jgi:hypothetical protein
MLEKEFPQSRPNTIDDGEYRFYNGATIVVRLRDGSAICRHVGMPDGFVGTPEGVLEEMLAGKLINAAGEKEAVPIMEAVTKLERLDSAGVNGLLKQVMAIIERDTDTK